MLIIGEFPQSIFKKAAITLVFIINVIIFFPWKYYPKKEYDKVREDNCSYLNEKKTFTGIELKASVCTNFNEWITL